MGKDLTVQICGIEVRLGSTTPAQLAAAGLVIPPESLLQSTKAPASLSCDAFTADGVHTAWLGFAPTSMGVEYDALLHLPIITVLVDEEMPGGMVAGGVDVARLAKRAVDGAFPLGEVTVKGRWATIKQGDVELELHYMKGRRPAMMVASVEKALQKGLPEEEPNYKKRRIGIRLGAFLLSTALLVGLVGATLYWRLPGGLMGLLCLVVYTAGVMIALPWSRFLDEVWYKKLGGALLIGFAMLAWMALVFALCYALYYPWPV